MPPHGAAPPVPAVLQRAHLHLHSLLDRDVLSIPLAHVLHRWMEETPGSLGSSSNTVWAVLGIPLGVKHIPVSALLTWQR